MSQKRKAMASALSRLVVPIAAPTTCADQLGLKGNEGEPGNRGGH
jgi:hypothetical protein